MKILRNLDLTDYNSYKVHGIASIALFPESVEDFRHLSQDYDISKAFIIGKGCNTIFARDYYSSETPLVFIRENFAKIEHKDNQLMVLSGTDLRELSIYAMEDSLSGLEYFYDIPGCVGGAITMNAGSCGVSFSDYISEIEYLDCKTGQVMQICKENLGVCYRNSVFKDQNKSFILSCLLCLPRGDKDTIWQNMKEIEKKRFSKQPREYPNAGSVFIRPSDTTYVGPMIEKLGLKGYRIGGAEVSQKHAGFIINTGNATGSDIVNLIDYIKNAVYDKYGIKLETEQRIVI